MSCPDEQAYIQALSPWCRHAETEFYAFGEEMGYYGTGFTVWGDQTNAKFIGAYCALAGSEHLDEQAAGMSREAVFDRAQKALRYAVRTHISGGVRGVDGRAWGNTWLSPLSLERMMPGVDAVWEQLPAELREGLLRVISSDADSVLEVEFPTDRFIGQGHSTPAESNYWKGAICARAALMQPDHPHAADWQERANMQFMNSLSVPQDAERDEVVAGRTIQEWHIGANLHPNYIFEHHGFFNPGYTAIVLSNMAMIDDAFRRRGVPAPETLHHNLIPTWQTLKRFVGERGRLLRAGGDQRQRYLYCQCYLLSVLAFMGRHIGDPVARLLEQSAFANILRDAEASGDGSFLSGRLTHFAQQNIYYYTRLESDVAVSLALAAQYHRDYDPPEPASVEAFRAQVRGSFIEPGANLVSARSDDLFVSWCLHSPTKKPCGLFIPSGGDHLAEWEQNMVGEVTAQFDQCHPKLDWGWEAAGEGCFVALAQWYEFDETLIVEGWRGGANGQHHYCLAALPDGRSAVVLSRVQVIDYPVYLRRLKGLKLNIANDIFNDNGRTYRWAGGEQMIAADSPSYVLPTGSKWICADDAVGVIALRGADGIALTADAGRTAGYGGSLHYDQICAPYWEGLRRVFPGEVLWDIAVQLVAGNAEEVEAQARRDSAAPATCEDSQVSGVAVTGLDGNRYAVVANFSPDAREFDIICPGAQVLAGEAELKSQKVVLAPQRAALLRL